MLYPSLYFGQPETVANLRPTCTVTLPAGMDLSSVETTCNPGDGTLCRSYTYNQYPVGSESIPDTAIQALLHSEPTNICKSPGALLHLILEILQKKQLPVFSRKYSHLSLLWAR